MHPYSWMDSSYIRIESGTDEWTSSDGIKIRAKIRNIDVQDGLVWSEKDQLGFAIRWSNRASLRRGASPIVSFNPSAASHSDWVELVIPPMTVKGRLDVEVALILVVPAETSKAKDQHLARLPGSLLWTGMARTILLDPDGDIFPIRQEGAGGSQPLWRLEIAEFDGIDELPFDETTVNVVINKQHPSFTTLMDIKHKDGDTLREAMLSSTIIAIMYACADEWEKVITALEAPHSESIAGVVAFWADKLDCGESLPEIDELWNSTLAFVSKLRGTVG